MDLADFRAMSFDCYGTLIDWEAGLLAVLRPWAREAEVDSVAPTVSPRPPGSGPGLPGPCA